MNGPQQYEWNVHHAEAMKAGIDPKIAQAIADGRRPDGMTDDETLLYDFCLELQRNRSISDPTYARMVARFGEKGVMDTVGHRRLLQPARHGAEHGAHAIAAGRQTAARRPCRAEIGEALRDALR